MRLSVLVLLLGGVALVQGEAFRPVRAQSADGELDVSSVTAVRIRGEASAVTLTTRFDRPLRAAAADRASAWFWRSSWFSGGCRSAAMRLDGGTLVVDVGSHSWFGSSDCVPEITANLPAGAAVSIEQNAVRARLTGDFSTVSLTGNAADVSLDGYAGTVRLQGDAMRVRLAFTDTRPTGDVDIAGRALDVRVELGEGPVSYAVEGSASLVDARMPSTPGAKPAIRIKGDFVRAVLR